MLTRFEPFLAAAIGEGPEIALHVPVSDHNIARLIIWDPTPRIFPRGFAMGSSFQLSSTEMPIRINDRSQMSHEMRIAVGNHGRLNRLPSERLESPENTRNHRAMYPRFDVLREQRLILEY